MYILLSLSLLGQTTLAEALKALIAFLGILAKKFPQMVNSEDTFGFQVK